MKMKEEGKNSGVKPRVHHFGEVLVSVATDLDQVNHGIIEEHQIHASATDALIIQLQEHIQTLL